MTLTAPNPVLLDQREAVDVTAAALERISVAAPYFALEQLTETDDGVAALVPISSPMHPETGFIEATQVARHLAILGSCAVALQREDDERHHYLATRAHFLRTANVTDPGGRYGGAVLEAEATGIWIDRRSARSLVKLNGPDGEASHILDVHYTVMTPRMFDRLMPPIGPALNGAGNGTRTIEADTMPAASNGTRASDPRIEFSVGSSGNDAVRFDCGPIPNEMCAGHFPQYPAAPVALVMGRLAQAAGLAMNRHMGFGELSYQVDEARVVATKLGRAGQNRVLNAEYVKRVGGGHLMRGTAEADGEVIGEMDLTLSVTCLPEPMPFPIGAL